MSRMEECIRHFRLFRYSSFTGEQVANLLVTGDGLVFAKGHQPTLEDLRGLVREFLIQASHGNTIAGAKAVLDEMDKQDRAVLDPNKVTP